MSRQLLKAWNVLSLDKHIHRDGVIGDTCMTLIHEKQEQKLISILELLDYWYNTQSKYLFIDGYKL